jgi:PqqD family protein of HPr-rel-A system
MSQHWKAISRPNLLWRSWDDECVIYNDLTGDTHLLDAASAEALRYLEREPADEEKLNAQMASSLEAAGEAELREWTGEIIKRFRRLGLIEPARP